MRNIQIITLFPDMFGGVLNTSMLLKAQKQKVVEFRTINLRDFGIGPRQQVDDTPYGGGDGMLLKIEPLAEAIQESRVRNQESRVILMTPRGKRYNQAKARQLAETDQDLIFVCPRYEGYDERIVDLVDEQISVGDYIVTGGELPAMMVIDSVVRLIPGVLGGETSAEIESFSEPGVLEFPQYTRPEVFKNKKVPPVLLSGNHAEIEKWRHNKSKSTDD